MKITTENGTTYDLGADADELAMAAAILCKQDLIKPLLEKMYEIGFKEALEKFQFHISNNEGGMGNGRQGVFQQQSAQET